MKAKDKTEDVLKQIHVLFSKAEPIEGSKRKVIIDKERMLALLKDLNDCMYSMMEEYELTDQSKEKAYREVQKKSDDIIFDARKNSEDIYAASIMFTDRALEDVMEIIRKKEEDLNKVHSELIESMEAKCREIKDNQLELKGKLSNLIDRQKYLKLIETENKRLLEEDEKKEEESFWGDDAPKRVTAEIRINPEYFIAAGLTPDGETKTEEIVLDGSSFDEIEGLEDTEETKGSEKKGFFSFGRKQG